MKVLSVVFVGLALAACSSSGAGPGRGEAGGGAGAGGASGDAGASGGSGAGGAPAGGHDGGSSGTSGGAGAPQGGRDGASTSTDAGDAAVPRDASDAAGADADGGAGATIVPLYTDPNDASWTAIVAAHAAHPIVRVVAIVNPDNGPGASKRSDFTAGIAKLVGAGVDVIGYVATGYASKSQASVEGVIDSWRSFYPQTGGIFFDEQSNDAADVAYYRALSQYAKAHGASFTVGNPGTDTAEAYVTADALDTMLIYESKGLPSVAKLGGWHAKYAPARFGIIPYGASFDAAFVRAARRYVGFVYIQSDDLPNPWDTLPPSFGDLLAALE